MVDVKSSEPRFLFDMMKSFTRSRLAVSSASLYSNIKFLSLENFSHGNSTVCLRNIWYNKYVIACDFSESELVFSGTWVSISITPEKREIGKSFFISIFNYTNKTIAFIKNKYRSSDVGGVWKIAWHKSLFAVI